MTEVDPQVVSKYKKFAAELLLDPDDPAALIDQMALLLNNGQQANAANHICLARRALRNEPDNVAVIYQVATALERIGNYQEALGLFQRCTGETELAFPVLSHLGACYRNTGRHSEAIETYEKALAIKPDDLGCKKDLAIALMADGQFARGMEAFEVRKQFAEEKAKHSGPLETQKRLPPGEMEKHWNGQPLEGHRVVVYHEEGSGDFIQFCRFLPMLRKCGAGAVLLTGPVPELLELVAENIPVDGIVPLAGPFNCDHVVGSMSLPWRCGATAADIKGTPYFNAEPATFPLRGLLNVGLCWRGNPNYGRDFHRSMPLSAFCPLFEIPGVAFYSLQAGEPIKEITALGLDGFIGDLQPFDKGWRATARLLKRLDGVISVDTAIAHLAGALGVPGFVLLANACDWRWDRNSHRTPWYDSLTVLRQRRQGDWGHCIGTLKQILEDTVNARRQASRADREGKSSLRAAE